MTSRTKRVIGAVVVLGVAAALVAASVGRDARSRVTVQTEQVGRRDLVSTVSASGEIKPKRFVNVSANVSGRIVRLDVKEGDTVRRGQVLARIDSTRVEAGQRQSQAAVNAARADLQREQADLEATRLAFERARSMRDQQLISSQEYERSEAEFKMKVAALQGQRDRIAQIEAQLASNNDDLEKTTVVAPMDGVVTNLQKEEGEVVIGAQSFQPTVIMTVGDLSVMEVEVLVDETDIQNLALGQPADVRVDALQGVKVKGQVTEIGSSAIPRGGATAGQTSANQAKDFKVTITLEAPPAALRPGLNATADIETGRKVGVLAVPIQAVVVREVDSAGKVIEASVTNPDPEASASAKPRSKGVERDGVFVVANGKAIFRAVKTGLVGESDIEIVEGLKQDEEIVTGSYKTLRTLLDDARIKVETPTGRKGSAS
jgi:HlyD family secretion protein